ncbi:MAG: beta-N-acetylhexosaminidase [Bacteroidaceae bacterium]|nr:beta-N-acetylhexosaminidase [Bacteroidaceae bacterium]
MKKTLTALLLATALIASAQSFVNLTPRPKSAVVNDGQLTLPPRLTVAYGSLPDSISREAARFVSDLNAATGLQAEAHSTGDGLIRLRHVADCAAEGYRLQVTTQGILVEATTTSGFFYAFQSLKKILPANVMARRYDAGKCYTLPCITVQDEPRFAYRGFMLDVSRHFFPVSELKRMIDLMAAYKMNYFHWHLTDDQGWRAEIEEYPRLTTVGATAPNCRVVDMQRGTYWTDRPYGPYFYTKTEMREVVEYCAQRHITVIPEVDMPGHFVAALAAYPEYSCDPANPPSVWTKGGVSREVLNVANPRAVAFAKHILGELCDIFPGPYFHIGGDECPTDAWKQNADCQRLVESEGLPNFRTLQSRFIEDMTTYLAERGKRTILWNESITAQGADLERVGRNRPIIFCWHPCQRAARMAAEQGLLNVVTEFHTNAGSYYINRKQSTAPGEPDGAGQGDDTVERCYNYVPVPTDVPEALQPFYWGVQATFWCEWVATADYLEYLALPRLMAVAEAGWTQQADKDFQDFRRRMSLDRELLDLGGYNYGKHIF